MAGADDEHTSTSEDERELRESERVRSHIYSGRYGSVDNPKIHLKKLLGHMKENQLDIEISCYATLQWLESSLL